MTTATKKRSTKNPAKKSKPESNGTTNGMLPDEGPDQERKEVDSSLSNLQAERDKLADKLKSVEGWRKKFRAAQAKVSSANADFELADAARKKAKAAIDAAIAKELELVSKFTSGEQLLPFDEVDQPKESGKVPTATPVGNDHGAAESIDALLAKNIKKTVGAEVFDRAKDSDNPIGMTEKQLDILKAKDIKTIGDIEKLMRENEWWHRDLKGIGPDKINRLTDTLLAFRQVYPVPSVPDSVGETKPESPQEPQPAEWEQSAYHLRELIAACNTMLESEITDDGKQFARSVAMGAEEMLAGITERQIVTADQKTAIENWTSSVAKWQK